MTAPPGRRRLCGLAVTGILLAVGSTIILGHPLSHSLSRLDIEGRNVRVTLTLDLLELSGVDRDANQLVSYEELDATIESVYARIRQHYGVRVEGAAAQVALERYEIVEDGHIARFHLRYTFSADAAAIDVSSTLDRITTASHRHLTSLVRDGQAEEAVLDRSNPTWRFETGGRSWVRTMWRFARVGIEHIVTGYDHLAFLLCLLLGTSTARGLVLVITSFTVAHSLTLALATFEIVVLPARLIESLIALSIAYVAAENLLRAEPVARHWVTFSFGLIHGFGFSNILRDMELPRANLALSLFSFNAGVEIGQLVFVVALFPILAFVTVARGTPVRSAVSLAVFGLAIYWFVERAILT